MRLDLHVHSRYSHDGVRGAGEIINTAIKRGLDGIAICDHDVFAAFEEAARLAPEGFVVIPGVEYSTDAGHVLALFVTRLYDLPRDGRGLCGLSALRREADGDGALLIAAHPYRKRSALPEHMLPLVDGVEIENSRDFARWPQNSEKAAESAARHGKFVTGGSDAHILREIGGCVTVLPGTTERTPAGVKNALLSGGSKAVAGTVRLRNQALSKLRCTRPRKLFKDIARLIIYTAKDVSNGV